LPRKKKGIEKPVSVSLMGISRFKKILNNPKTRVYPQKRHENNGYPQRKCEFAKSQDAKEQLSRRFGKFKG
jgi:hypothetical protein